MRKYSSILLTLLFVAGCYIPSSKPEKGHSANCQLTVSGALNGTFPCEVVQYFEPKGAKLAFNLVYVYGEAIKDPGGTSASVKSRSVAIILPATGVGEFPIVDFDRAIASSQPIAGALFDDFYPSGRVGFNEDDHHRFYDHMKGKVNLISRAPYVGNFEFTSKGNYGSVTVQGRFAVD